CGIAYVQMRRGLKALITCVALFVVASGLRHSDLLPKLLDRFVVKPNPVKVEREFMDNNIKATQAAYDLNRIRTLNVTAEWSPDAIDPRLHEYLHNIPIWDPEFLDDVYQQLQGIRPYYNFTDVDVARYDIKGVTEQVNLAARELNIAKLPKEAQNWENTHLRYTHGFGAVITPAAQSGDQPMQWFLRDLNLQSDVGFSIEKPDIYFGTENLQYAVVPNKLKIVDISSFDMESSQNYSGKDGVQISSLFRKLITAIYFRDEKLFFSVNIDGNSKVLFRRNIVDRIKTLTPYLSLDHDPYIVVTPKRIFWVQDAYTTSGWYPVSKSSRFKFKGDEEEQEFNYVRNSVKIVVDAFGGTTDYYVSDPNDPIIQGYRNAYPGLFKDIRELPPLLKDQLRYPRDIFSVKMGMYAKYHQTDPALFYQQAETWDFAKVNDKPVVPYYLTTLLVGADELQDFVLLNPMTPIGRSNLSALAVAGNERFGATSADFKEEIVVYKFSREVQVDGPSQVSALIDQNPEIARLFSLWDQRGSHVLRGRMILLPIGRSLLYVQPIYLVSTGNIKIPELTRVILSMGNVVVMEPSLERALDALEAKLKATQPTAAQPPQRAPAAPASSLQRMP
ncbi:MAG: putative rane protein, partial [Proteobacteria bacterium]|nr:putative rane protein [Pseudomonadota bacterium]